VSVFGGPGAAAASHHLGRGRAVIRLLPQHREHVFVGHTQEAQQLRVGRIIHAEEIAI